jgi:hypothetical protein
MRRTRRRRGEQRGRKQDDEDDEQHEDDDAVDECPQRVVEDRGHPVDGVVGREGDEDGADDQRRQERPDGAAADAGRRVEADVDVDLQRRPAGTTGAEAVIPAGTPREDMSVAVPSGGRSKWRGRREPAPAGYRPQ